MLSERSKQAAKLKAVIFDYGEVLSDRPTPDEFARLAGMFGVGMDVFPALWERHRAGYDRGDLTPEVYWSMVARDAGAQIRPGLLEEACQLDLAMWSKVNPAMVEWASQLRASGMKIGLLSNMHQEMVTYARERLAWLENFDYVTFSAEVRLIKPDPAIYQHTLRGLDLAASEALFLDDREVNIQAARNLGMTAIRFESMAQVREELRAVGFARLPASS